MKSISLSSLCNEIVVIAALLAAVNGCGGAREIAIGHDRDASIVGASGGASGQDARTVSDRGASPAGTGGMASAEAGAVDGASISDAGGSDQGGADGPLGCQSPTPGVSACGPNCESCSTNLLVTGGTYLRSYDGVFFSDRGNPATVSNFRLDKFEVTVGRFRQFVAAVIGGWRPASGGGKHTHLNGGLGLADSGGIAGTFETGWNSLWNNNLSSTPEGWNTSPEGPSLSQPLGDYDSGPIDLVSWYHAYAFCIWDGGFLPSEAEWNYAASGGNEQRLYPWSTPPSSAVIDCSYLNFEPEGSSGASCSFVGVPAPPVGLEHVGSRSPKGDGKWGQSDLAGNVSEWTMDWFVNYATPCVDCAYLAINTQPVSERVLRGGAADRQAAKPGSPSALLTSDRVALSPSGIDSFVNPPGIRCARTP